MRTAAIHATDTKLAASAGKVQDYDGHVWQLRGLSMMDARTHAYIPRSLTQTALLRTTNALLLNLQGALEMRSVHMAIVSASMLTPAPRIERQVRCTVMRSWHSLILTFV